MNEPSQFFFSDSWPLRFFTNYSTNGACTTEQRMLAYDNSKSYCQQGVKVWLSSYARSQIALCLQWSTWASDSSFNQVTLQLISELLLKKKKTWTKWTEIYSAQINLASQISWPAGMPLSLPTQQDAQKWRVNISLYPCCSIKMNNSLCQCHSSPPVCQTVLFFLAPSTLWGGILRSPTVWQQCKKKKKSYLFFLGDSTLLLERRWD